MKTRTEITVCKDVLHLFLIVYPPLQDQYKFCYDILNLLVTTKLGTSSLTQTASDSGNESPDVPDTEAPETSGTDNPETSGTDNPETSGTDSPDISGTNDAGFTESQEPLLSYNDEQEAESKEADEINEVVKGDTLL